MVLCITTMWWYAVMHMCIRRIFEMFEELNSEAIFMFWNRLYLFVFYVVKRLLQAIKCLLLR